MKDLADKILRQGIAEIFPASGIAELTDRLTKPDRPLRIKLGIDPTRPDLHLGHAVVLNKMRQFQDAGHTAVLIIGDFTAQIGDPTGKSEMRPRLSKEEVEYNAKTYFEQAKKILDFDTNKLEVKFNSEWLNNLDLSIVISLLASMTVGQMLAKEDFSERYKQGTPIYLHEFLYPLMQGYDSVTIDADVELGGTEQKFNILVGRDLQTRFNKPGQMGVLLPLLVGLDGEKKMSKSLDNYVGLTEDPLSMYSKLEKVPDRLVDSYFELLTDIDPKSLTENARQKQKRLAMEIVSRYYDPDRALQAQREAEQIVLSGNTSNLEQVPEFLLSGINFPIPLFYLLKTTGLCKSNSDAQSQINNGAVKMDGEKMTDPNYTFNSIEELSNRVLQVGKKKFLKLIPAQEQ
jgi:tyrosyl-tRNA synthetase